MLKRTQNNQKSGQNATKTRGSCSKGEEGPGIIGTPNVADGDRAVDYGCSAGLQELATAAESDNSDSRSTASRHLKAMTIIACELSAV